MSTVPTPDSNVVDLAGTPPTALPLPDAALDHAMTGPVGVVHPPWCSRLRCEFALGGAHSSLPIVIGATFGHPTRCAVRVWSPVDPATRVGTTVYVEIVLGDHTTAQRTRVDLSPAQSLRLATVLTGVVPR